MAHHEEFSILLNKHKMYDYPSAYYVDRTGHLRVYLRWLKLITSIAFHIIFPYFAISRGLKYYQSCSPSQSLASLLEPIAVNQPTAFISIPLHLACLALADLSSPSILFQMATRLSHLAPLVTALGIFVILHSSVALPFHDREFSFLHLIMERDSEAYQDYIDTLEAEAQSIESRQDAKFDKHHGRMMNELWRAAARDRELNLHLRRGQDSLFESLNGNMSRVGRRKKRLQVIDSANSLPELEALH